MAKKVKDTGPRVSKESWEVVEVWLEEMRKKKTSEMENKQVPIHPQMALLCYLKQVGTSLSYSEQPCIYKVFIASLS